MLLFLLRIVIIILQHLTKQPQFPFCQGLGSSLSETEESPAEQMVWHSFCLRSFFTLCVRLIPAKKERKV